LGNSCSKKRFQQFFPLHFLLLFLVFEFGIQYGKKQNSGSGINIPDPQHCYNTSKMMAYKGKIDDFYPPGLLVFVPYVPVRYPIILEERERAARREK
jgi:hypothetical protein